MFKATPAYSLFNNIGTWIGSYFTLCVDQIYNSGPWMAIVGIVIACIVIRAITRFLQRR